MTSPHSSIPVPGWYPDPEYTGHVCYWDGTAWDPHSRRPSADFEQAHGKVIQGEVLAAESVPLDVPAPGGSDDPDADAAPDADAESDGADPDAANAGSGRAARRRAAASSGSRGRGRRAAPGMFIPHQRRGSDTGPRLRPAPLPRRLLARVADLIVPLGVGAAVAFAVVPGALDHLRAKADRVRYEGRTETVWLLDGTTAAAAGWVLGAVLLAMLFYEAVPTWLRGRSLGKALFGLRVVDVATQRGPSPKQAFRRWLVFGVPGVLGIGVLGLLWGAFDRPWRQAWHDKAAGTFVGHET